MPTILVVDDEELIRKWVVAAISSFGEYDLQACDPATALQTAGQYQIELLLSDCVMQSSTSGPALARKIMAADDHVKVIWLSRCQDTNTVYLDRDWRFISKPFSPAVLRATIREVLAEQPQVPAPDIQSARRYEENDVCRLERGMVNGTHVFPNSQPSGAQRCIRR